MIVPGYIQDVFGAGGLLSKQFPGYTPRKGQIEMAALVDAGYRQPGLPHIVEAPTGTGKSLAYLIPAAYHAHFHRRVTLIVTNNKKLQHQLTDKDLPLTQRTVPWSFTTAIAKGKTNYVCNNDTWEEGYGHELSPQVLDWVLRTRTGDFLELSDDRSINLDRTKRLLALEVRDDCLIECDFRPSRTTEGEQIREDQLDDRGVSLDFPRICFPYIARQKYMSADIVVTNYKMLAMHQEVFKTSGFRILPDFDAIICDEAHHLADQVRDHLSVRFTLDKLLYLNSKDKELKRLGAKFHDSLVQMFAPIEAAIARANRRREPSPPPVLFFDKTLYAAGPLYEHLYKKAELQHAADQETARVGRRFAKMAERVAMIASHEYDKTHARFIHKDDSVLFVGSRTVNVTSFLQPFWEKTSVLTSATLCVEGSFDFVLEGTGCAKDTTESEDEDKPVKTRAVRTNRVESPFDFKNNSLLYACNLLPSPRSESRDKWERLLPGAYAELLTLNGGRALCLFTSRRVMNNVHKALKKMNLPFRIYVQGEGTLSNERVFAQFIADETSVLLAVSSFWEGADAPGKTCTMVIIDKLPFPVPSSIEMLAIEERTENYFNREYMPRMVIPLVQGLGRLLRTVEDSGLAVLLDIRFWDHKKRLIASLPPGMPVTHNFQVVRRFLKEKAQTLVNGHVATPHI